MPKYDLVVIGAGLGGLAAAVLSAKNGKRVVVLEPGDAAGGVVRPVKKEAFLFNPGPQLTFGLDRAGDLHQFIEQVGITLQESLRSPCFQVVLPNHRITVFGEQSETLEELNREFPQHIDEIKSFYLNLRKQAIKNEKSRVSSFFSRVRSAGPFIRSYRFSKEFLSFLDVQSFYFFRQPASALSLNSLITLFDSTPYSVGFGKLAVQLVEALLKNGGEIRYRIPLSNKTLASRTIYTPQGEINFDAALINTEQQNRSALFLIGLRDQGVPAGMERYVLALPDYTHPEQFFTLSLDSGHDQTVAPRGTRALTAEFPASADLTNAERTSEIKELIPFLDDFTVFTEEVRPILSVFSFPDQIKFKQVQSVDRHSLLFRTSMKGVYLLADGAGTPLQAISAARRFINMTR